MSSLLTMVTFDTPDNGRSPMTRATLQTLRETVDFTKHTLMVSDNGSCQETHSLYKEYVDIISHVEYNGENIGTANALNRLWRFKQPRHKCVVKIDNDVEIHMAGWVDLMERVFERMPKVGICGLKRKDLEEWPDNPSPWWKSKLLAVPHKRGEPWLILEEVNHVMGTCQAYRGSLVGEEGRFGFLFQPGPYGLDDAFAAVRMKKLGYTNVFLHTAVPIDHIDPGGTEFTQWKQDEAGKWINTGIYQQYVEQFKSGERPVYYDGGF